MKSMKKRDAQIRCARSVRNHHVLDDKGPWRATVASTIPAASAAMHAFEKARTQTNADSIHPRPSLRPTMSLYSEKQLAFTIRLPKVELHAHLNGSIRRSTLAELAASAGVNPAESMIVKGDTRSLSEFFAVFDIIHRLVRGAKAIRRITREVLEDAEADGVAYFEMRTTPRSHEEHQLTEEGYVEAVLGGFADYAAQHTNSPTRCYAALLLSIDRHSGAEVAQRTVELALRYRGQGVIGVDLSGDPTKGHWSLWLPALTRAKEANLKITLHAGEAPDSDKEMHQMLDFHPVSRLAQK